MDFKLFLFFCMLVFNKRWFTVCDLFVCNQRIQNEDAHTYVRIHANTNLKQARTSMKYVTIWIISQLREKHTEEMCWHNQFFPFFYHISRIKWKKKKINIYIESIRSYVFFVIKYKIYHFKKENVWNFISSEIISNRVTKSTWYKENWIRSSIYWSVQKKTRVRRCFVLLLQSLHRMFH